MGTHPSKPNHEHEMENGLGRSQSKPWHEPSYRGTITTILGGEVGEGPILAKRKKYAQCKDPPILFSNEDY
ncbi:hypothetical protein CR513_22301, partial [Mucuna pruriens]